MDIKERFYANLNMIREEAEQLDEADKMKLPKGYGKILPKKDAKNRKVLKKSNMDKRAAKAGMNVPKGYGDIVSYDKK